MYRAILSLFIIMTLVLTSCKKDSDYANFSLITEKEWHLTSVDLYDQIITEACHLDNSFFFHQDNSATTNYGPLFCEDDMQDYKAEWTFTEKGSGIRLSFTRSSSTTDVILHQIWMIESITETELILSAENSDLGKISKTYIAEAI